MRNRYLTRSAGRKHWKIGYVAVAVVLVEQSFHLLPIAFDQQVGEVEHISIPSM